MHRPYQRSGYLEEVTTVSKSGRGVEWTMVGFALG